MFESNASKLRGKIFEKGFNISSFAEAVGINRNYISEITRSDEKLKRVPLGTIQILADNLCDNYAEATDIFFKEKLAKDDSQNITTG